MKPQPTFAKDFVQVLFSSQNFFEQRFLELSSRRIHAISFVGIFFGLLVGNLITMSLSRYVMTEFAVDATPYSAMLTTLGLTPAAFVEMLKAQHAYSTMLACLSPLVAYIAPHLFGGALYIFMWLLYRPNNQFEFHRVMDCAAISLTAMAFYAIPGIGPIVAIVGLSANTSRAVTAYFKLAGFFKIMSIVSALYLCFLLTSGTLHLLSQPVAQLLE